MRARRVDANHKAIKDAFLKLGCSVMDLSQAPVGCDLAVGYGGLCMLVEVKDGSKRPSARRLTKNEQRAMEHWTGGIRLVMDMTDVVATAIVLKQWHARVSGR